ncbi:MAG: hypothetical protein GQ574_05835 [Crocinitomix sp.]|nr:hypothetical protein [Crocinitomix sp.]
MFLTQQKKILEVIRFFEIDQPESYIYASIIGNIKTSGRFSTDDYYDIICRVIEKFYTKLYIKEKEANKTLKGIDRFFMFLNMVKNEANGVNEKWQQKAIIYLGDFHLLNYNVEELENVSSEEYLNQIIIASRNYLTKTEFEVAELLQKGKKSVVIAGILNRDPSYIRNVMAKVMRKIRENNP